MKMKKMKLLTAVLLCLGITGMVSAIEVISIDFNKQGDANAYTGEGAIECENCVWRVYEGYPTESLGKAMGSPRTANLADSDDPCESSTYAAQVWISDDANNHGTYDSCSTVVGLMDDGFEKTGGGNDPCITLWGRGAYGGMDPNYITYDLYVYGNDAGSFKITFPTLSDPDHNETNSVTGGIPPGQGFLEPNNFVVFEDVNIGADTNVATLVYTNKLNGLQLVKKLRTAIKVPVVMQTGAEINAPEYDVAYETNLRGGEETFFGPDLGSVPCGDPPTYITGVTYLDTSEYMEYDITVTAGNDGNYAIYAYVDTGAGNPCHDLTVYVDGVLFGDLEQDEDGPVYPTEGCFNVTDNEVHGNIFAGDHTFKWQITGGDHYYNLQKFVFVREGDIAMADCNDVYKYGFNDPNDFNHDCHVDFNDLASIAANWADCYSPDPNDCL